MGNIAARLNLQHTPPSLNRKFIWLRYPYDVMWRNAHTKVLHFQFLLYREQCKKT